MKKNYKIIAMILMIVNIFTCFIPTYFYAEVWEYIGPGHGRQTAKYGISMFDVNTDYIAHHGPVYTFSCIVAICWVICIGAILYSIIRGKDHKLIWFSPCISLVPFFVFSECVQRVEYNWSNGNGFTSYSINWMFYVSLALQICAAALMIIAMTGKELPFSLPKSAPKVSEADELAKYKELLDKGVITQEEFDAKKKQILGL